MTPDWFPQINLPGTSQVYGNYHGGGYHQQNSGHYDNYREHHSVESYTGKLDKATQNYYIASGLSRILGGMTNDPEAQRFLGIVGDVTGTIAGVRDYSNRERYYNEQHHIERNSGAWNNTQRGWTPGNSYYLDQSYNFVDPRVYGPYNLPGSGHSQSHSHHHSESSGYYNNGWNSGGYHYENGGGHNSQSGWVNNGWPFGGYEYGNSNSWEYGSGGSWSNNPIYTPGWNTWPPIICW
jgi:hypothetical protein